MSKTKEILERQLKLLSEQSSRIVNDVEVGKELPALTNAMIGVALILEPEMQNENLISYLEKQRFWAQLRDHWRQNNA